MVVTTESENKRFSKFLTKLSELSKECGVIISGSVWILNDDDTHELEEIKYVNDPSSGDLDYRPPKFKS